MRRSVLILAALSFVGCRVSAEAKTGSGVNASIDGNESRSSSTETVSTTPPSPPPPPPASSAPPPPPAPPPASACPLDCYVASGGDRIAVTDQELQSIRSGLEPVMGRMRACADAETWRRRGSPTILLRVAPDGSAAEVDVDPHHGYELEARCMDSAAQGASVAVSLPGRAAVRCVERCVAEKRTKKKR